MPTALLFVFFFGGILGLSVGMVGTGSVIAVPLLLYGSGLDVHSAVCVAMLTTSFLGIIGSMQKARAGAINVRDTAVISIAGMLVAPFGAWLNKQIPPGLLLLMFAVVVFAISIWMLVQRRPSAIPQKRSNHHVNTSVRSGGAGAVIGLLGGVLGISGGFIAVPVLIAEQGLEVHRAVATSWAIVALVSGSATLGHFLAGQKLSFIPTVLFLMGSIIGFEAGMPIGRRFSEVRLKRIFAAAIVLMSVAMVSRLIVEK